MRLKDFALFVLRVGIGGAMLYSHGIPKILNFTQLSGSFPDPLGVGSTTSLVLAIGAEVVAALALILGFYGRWAAAILTINMAVAAFIFRAGESFADRELAIVYLIPFVALMIAGTGSWSVTRPKRSLSGPVA